MTSPHVVILGDLMTDVVARMHREMSIGSDTPAQVGMTGGGSAGNVAAWLAATGTAVTFVGRVGADAAGAARAAELADAGVDVVLAVDEEVATGAVVVLVDPSGERTMLPDRGANLRLSPADVPEDRFVRGGHLHLSGYAVLDPGPRSAALHALELARAAGMSISVDPSSAAPLADVGSAAFLGWTSGADLCLPNLDEARVLTGCVEPEAAAARLSESFSHVVVTLGAEGALWMSAGAQAIRWPAAPAVVVDTTGAGDAFAAGYLCAMLRREPVRQRLRAGADLAAEAVALDGARPRRP